MEKFEKALYTLRYHKMKDWKSFPTYAATFIVLCIWKVILSYTNFKSCALLRSSNARENLACRILVERRERKRTLGTIGRRCEDNIKINKEMGWGRILFHLPQNRNNWRTLVNTVINILFAQNAGNFINTWGTNNS